MRVPLTWLREYVDLPADVTARDLAGRLTLAGLEIETVDELGSDITGPIVYGRVLEIEELTGFKKPIRFCRVDVGGANGTGEPQEIVCGARNFAEGDLVVVCLPGAELPGGFRIGARKTYGRMSAGMICSATELGLWEDHTGIVVLPEGFGEVGENAIGPLGLREDVLDIAVTPDRGYALSLRGVARDTATLYGVELRDPADITVAAPTGKGHAAEVAPALCDRYVLRGVTGFDPDAPSPLWMRRRLHHCGVRPISLAVDVTNYVMLELGQPLHAWDRAQLRGALRVRAAEAGEKLETLDHVQRSLDADDIVIADDSGPVNIAGVMGGLTTEISLSSTEVLVEAGHFDAMHIARASRRHQLSSESSRRFERGVDSAVQLAAATRAVELLAELGGASVESAYTHVDHAAAREPVAVRDSHAGSVAGVDYPEGTTERWLRAIGCEVSVDGDLLSVVPPTWRPDITDPNDLAEEVIRFEGYENIPSIRPLASGRGLTASQRLRRAVGRSLADTGFHEVLNYPFVGERDLDGLQMEADDDRRTALRLANPLNDGEPLLRTTLLPGLFKALARNVGRGFTDVALYEMGLVYLPRPGAPKAPMLPVDRGPSPEELALIEAALPEQPLRLGAVVSGNAERAGWWGPGREATWADAIQVARDIARVAGAELEVEADQRAPWHPGRSARSHLLSLARTHRIPNRRVDEVLETVGLTEAARKRAGTFSLGMSQRLGIAAALLGDPGLLLFDEPVNGLDPDGVRWIRDLMRSLADEGRTVFVSSHLMSEMQLTADHLVVLGRGRLLTDAPLTQVLGESAWTAVLVRAPHPEDLITALEGEGARVDRPGPGELVVTGMPVERVGELAHRAGVALHELSTRDASLEQAYRELAADSVQYTHRS